jgi:glycosyltransferase involved in cell wall biosynthesis
LTTTLRVIIDQMIAPVPGGIGRYTEELTRELIATAPLGCDVAGVVSASPESDYADVLERLPGLSNL